MRVAFNARLLHFPSLRGWNRYTVNLLAELPGAGVEPILYLDRPIDPAHAARLPESTFPTCVAPPMRGLAFEQRWLPRQCKLDRVDVLHSPFNFGLPWSSPCPRVLTLHDAIEEVYYRRRVPLRERLRPSALRQSWSVWASRVRADRVMTVSQHARGDLVRHLGIPDRKVVVTYEAADPQFHQPIGPEARARVRAAHELARPYVFYIGGWERRKNLPFLLDAFARAGLDGVELVLAGGGQAERAALIEQAGSLGIGDRLRLLGWIEDADLPALYAEALCFAYPSEYEGFGLQLCEAMAAGCPALAARATCLPEILGDGGATFALADPAELVGLLRRVHGEPDYRAELVRRGHGRVAGFSWRRTAEETAAVYRELVAGGRR